MPRTAFLLTAIVLLLVRASAQQPAPAPPRPPTATELIPLLVVEGKYHGDVDLSVDIDATGNVAQITALGGDTRLIQAATKAVRTFLYVERAGVTGAHEHVSFVSGKELHTVPPTYPPVARMVHAQGAVELAAVVQPDGHVSKVVALSGPPALRDSAADSLKQWTFPPAHVAGTPVPARALVIMIFAMVAG